MIIKNAYLNIKKLVNNKEVNTIMWKGKLCKNNLKNKLIGGGFIILIISIGIILALNSCNRQIVDLNFHFDYAIIHL